MFKKKNTLFSILLAFIFIVSVFATGCKEKSNEACERFLDEFKSENGSYICNDLLGCDISTQEGVKYAVENNLFKEFCPLMVESASKIVKGIINEE